MSRSRLLILGMDGMDYDFALSMGKALPAISRLADSGTARPLQSVFPPDSIPSWITAYTGKDPSEHGILESVNYLAKKDERLKVDTSIFQGKTFWDILGNSGIDVCVINPFMAYPVWPVNGVMVNGPVFIDDTIQVSDPSWVNGLHVPKSLGGIVDFPTRKTLDAFVEKTIRDTVDQAEFGLEMFRRHRPGLFFQTFLTVDRIQHFLWRYCDRSDPTFPGENPFENVIRDFYVEIDRIIGRFLDMLNPDDRLVVISDHGHGMRCTHCVNLNEFLRHRGHLRSSAEGKRFSTKLLVEKLKNGVLNFMNEHDLEDYISVIAKFVPNAKKIKKGKHITDKTRNRAYASDFTGTNPFGGICINKELVEDYEEFRSKLMEELEVLQDKGRPVFQWMKRREEMYDGPFLKRFPDILFCLDEKYGVNWGLHTKIFTVNPTHKKISGGHREKGVFFSNMPSARFKGVEQVRMDNLFSTILDLFGVRPEPYSKGLGFWRANE